MYVINCLDFYVKKSDPTRQQNFGSDWIRIYNTANITVQSTDGYISTEDLISPNTNTAVMHGKTGTFVYTECRYRDKGKC
jgi:hypothetical protein